MPSQNRIGAIIGIDGAREYSRAMQTIISYTRELRSEVSALTEAYNKNHSWKDITNLQKSLSDAIKATNGKLEAQKDLLQRMQGDMSLLEEDNQEFIRTLNDQQNEVNKTERVLYQYQQRLEELPSKLEFFVDTMKNANNELTRQGEAMKEIGGFLTKYVTAPIVAGGSAGVKFASDWESAFAGVKKTVEGTDEDYALISKGIREIALESASSAEDIAAVAEAAGQLGISKDDIVDFTKVMVQLGDSTNLSADEAAVALARVLNITGEDTGNIDRIGAAIVDLGNNFATSESEIVAMTNRLAAGGTLAGLTTQDILGLATAMSSVGITAEAGGTAMSQTLTNIEKEFAAFNTGAESNLPRIAEIAGMSAEDFAEAWQNRPIEAVQNFISGLGGLDEKGESATLVLDELGMAGIRQSNMLKSLSLASDVLVDAVDRSNTAYEENTALTDEASRRYETFASQVSQLKEAFKEFMSSFGSTIAEMLLPAIEGLTTLFHNLATWWNGLSEPMQRFIVSIAGIVAAIGPLLLVGGNMLIWVGKVKAALEAFGGLSTLLAPLSGLGSAIGSIASAIGGFALAHPVLLAITAGITAFAIAAKEMGITWEDVKGGLLAIWEATKEAWNLFWDAIGEGVSKIGQFLGELVLSFDKKLGEIFSFLGQKAKDAFLWAIDFVSNMASGISSTISNVYTAITNGLSSAWEYISQKVSDAWSWGSDLMSNLASGISSGVSWVVDKVKSVADKIWSYLHFSEPEIGPLRNFNTWMPDMMRQMAKGINDNSWMVEDAINNVAGRMSMSPQSNAFNYGGVVINLNVPEGANGQMLVDEIETELANRTMRRRAVFG